ncbi:MAG: hypothetical protein WCH39_11250 [Schlesneria sp.]
MTAGSYTVLEFSKFVVSFIWRLDLRKKAGLYLLFLLSANAPDMLAYYGWFSLLPFMLTAFLLFSNPWPKLPQ